MKRSCNNCKHFKEHIPLSRSAQCCARDKKGKALINFGLLYEDVALECPDYIVT